MLPLYVSNKIKWKNSMQDSRKIPQALKRNCDRTGAEKKNWVFDCNDKKNNCRGAQTSLCPETLSRSCKRFLWFLCEKMSLTHKIYDVDHDNDDY